MAERIEAATDGELAVAEDEGAVLVVEGASTDVQARSRGDGGGAGTAVGGLGLIAVAIIDNSFIPIPGGLDVATILLSSSNPGAWPYYGFMRPTLGACLEAPRAACDPGSDPLCQPYLFPFPRTPNMDALVTGG